jgi:hypothetical protein
MSESREQRIATLANTLKASGIAKSDSQAKMMAEDMIGVEEHVQQHYEVEHTRATEYLQTAKNLGDSRTTNKPQVQPVSMIRESPRDRQKPVEQIKPVWQKPVSRMIEPIPTSNDAVDAKTSSQKIPEHDTGNSAIEAIKAQMSKEYIKPLYDRYEEESHKSETSQKIQPIETVKDESKIAPIETVKNEPKIASPIEAVKNEGSKILEAASEVKEEPVKLDAQRLIDMMEEDGNKMEEHTKEIKEKPKDVKPKEAYAENSIDLAAIFAHKK